MAWRQHIRRHWTFNGPQRRVLVLLLVFTFSYALLNLSCNTAFIDDPQPEQGARYDQLADRIDPNTATWYELAALPMLGEKRARAFIDFRTRAQARDKTEFVFRTPEDFYRIEGFGPKLVEQILPYLVFKKQSATRPN
jgi:hypothetical protein